MATKERSMRRRIKKWIEENQLTALFNTLAATAGFVLLLPFIHRWSAKLPPVGIALAIIVVSILFLLSLYTLVDGIIHYRERAQTLKGLAMLYLELILLYASVYYILIAISPAFFHGLGEIAVPSNHQLSFAFVKRALIIYLNAVHFSIVTATTEGYGDMVPAAVTSRLLVDSQILMSVGLAVAGFGTFFASLRESEK
jgi:Ion channel